MFRVLSTVGVGQPQLPVPVSLNTTDQQLVQYMANVIVSETDNV